MPELPEVETIRRGLEKTIIGKKIADVDVRLPKIVSIGPAVVSNIRKSSLAKVKTFKKLLIGQKILNVGRRAKMLMIDVSPASPKTASRGGGPSFSILVHLKMTGQLVFSKKGEKKVMKILNIANGRLEPLPHKYTHVIFGFSDGSRLYYNDMRQFGYLRVVTDRELLHVRELLEYGPEPRLAGLYPRSAREPDIPFLTLEHLITKAKTRPKLSVKQFLMDPKVVAGIGNIYSDEILYWAKIRPARSLRSLDRADFKGIYRAISKVLAEAIKAQGSSVGDFFKVDGSEGGYGLVHMVYGRYVQLCKKCGTIIKSVKLGGRTGSYCPVCQK